MPSKFPGSTSGPSHIRFCENSDHKMGTNTHFVGINRDHKIYKMMSMLSELISKHLLSKWRAIPWTRKKNPAVEWRHPFFAVSSRLDSGDSGSVSLAWTSAAVLLPGSTLQVVNLDGKWCKYQESAGPAQARGDFSHDFTSFCNVVNKIEVNQTSPNGAYGSQGESHLIAFVFWPRTARPAIGSNTQRTRECEDRR